MDYQNGRIPTLPKFEWKHRLLCLLHIFVIVKCQQVEVRKAVIMAVEYKDHTGQFLFCKDPFNISDSELDQLYDDAQRVIAANGRFEQVEQLILSL